MKSNIISSIGLIVILILAVAGCSGDRKIANPAVDNGHDSPATLEKRISRNNQFAMDLYRQLAISETGDFVVCPHSISIAFGMAYAGARNDTERQIAEVLHFNYPPQGFHSELSGLNALLESREGTEIDIENGCWVDSVYHYEQDYIDTLTGCYQAEVQNVDFMHHPEEARQAINEWAYDNCGLINLFPEGSLTPLTYMVLVNTMVFDGEWEIQFDPEYTSMGEFTRIDSTTRNTFYMKGECSRRYYQGDGFQALELPFKERNMSMILILPEKGKFLEFEENFSTAVLDSITESFINRTVHMEIPRFVIDSGYDLIETMRDMGLTLPFDAGADFSGIDGTSSGSIWISVLVHRAEIVVTEYGVHAAAATGMGFILGEVKYFLAHHPFIYLIRDIETGTILFMGRIMDPVEPWVPPYPMG